MNTQYGDVVEAANAGRNTPLQISVNFLLQNRKPKNIIIRNQHQIYRLLYKFAIPLREYDRELSTNMLQAADDLKDNEIVLNSAGGDVRGLFRFIMARRQYQTYTLTNTQSLIKFLETVAMVVRGDDVDLSELLLKVRDRIEDNYDRNTSAALVVAEYFCE